VKPALALIFDLDGVIVDSTPIHNRAWELYLRRSGIDPAGIEPRMLGQHNSAIVRDFFGEGLSELEIARHGSAKEVLYRELMAGNCTKYLVDGIVDFLEMYADWPKAVASNAERANVEFVLDGCHLRDHFLAVLDSSQIQRPKPAPEVYLRAAELLNASPRDCVVFEDSPVGVAAARASGASVVGVRTAVRDLDGVDYAVDGFRDARLRDWLGERNLEALARRAGRDS
jgi:beta-phosphoglucomutase